MTNNTDVLIKQESKKEIDHRSLHTDNPAWGARQLSAQLKKRGYQVGRRKTRRYMNEREYPKVCVNLQTDVR